MDTYHYLYPNLPIFVPLFFAALLLRWFYNLLNKPFKKMWKAIKRHTAQSYWWLHETTHMLRHSSRRGYYNPLYAEKPRRALRLALPAPEKPKLAKPIAAKMITAKQEKPFTPQPKFKPWRADYPYILGMIVTGFAWMFLASLIYSSVYSHPALLVMAMLGVVPLYIGAVRLDNVFERKHGAAVEQKASAALIAMLPKGWTARRNVRIWRGGDIDLLIKSFSGDTCVIDVKSWHSWSGYRRTLKAIKSIKRQKAMVEATYAAIWLPHAKEKSLLRQEGYVILSGDAAFALRYLRQQLRHLVAIKFPEAPAEDIRKFVSQMGFRWDKKQVHWKGRLSDQQIAALQPKIRDFGGMLDKIEKVS